MKKLLTGILLVTFVASPAVVMADAPSYANKKNGKVSFNKGQDEATETATENQSSDDVSKIEPAAGAQDETSETPVKEENSLAERMKLPRK